MFCARTACFAASSLLNPPVPPRPRCRIRVPRQSMAPYPCSMPIHSGVSVFHADPCRCHEAVPRVQNRKSACSATFLRLGIVTDPCNRRLGRKSAGGLLQSGCFRLCGGRGESLIAKKLQKRSDFCFCGRWIAAAGQISQRADRRSGADCAKSWFSVGGRIRPHPFCCAFCLRRCYSLCNGMRAFFGWLQRCGVDCMWGFRCA